MEKWQIGKKISAHLERYTQTHTQCLKDSNIRSSDIHAHPSLTECFSLFLSLSPWPPPPAPHHTHTPAFPMTGPFPLFKSWLKHPQLRGQSPYPGTIYITLLHTGLFCSLPRAPCYLTLSCLCVHFHVFGMSVLKESEMKVTQSCPTLFGHMDYTVHGILQARILEWVAFPFSKGSSHPWADQVSCVSGGFFTSKLQRRKTAWHSFILLNHSASHLVPRIETQVTINICPRIGRDKERKEKTEPSWKDEKGE